MPRGTWVGKVRASYNDSLKFFNGQPTQLDDLPERAWFEIAIMGRHGHATRKISRMSKNDVTAGRVANDEMRLFKRLDNLPPG